MNTCPFCKNDPYEYVDVGVGYVPVAVTCCDLGVILFDWRHDNRWLVKYLELRRSYSPRKKARAKRIMDAHERQVYDRQP